MSRNSQTLKGVFGGVRWASDDGNFLIGTLEDGTTIKGSASRESLIHGVEYDFSGSWQNHPSYGRQFQFDAFVAQQPRTPDAVMAYLSKHLFGCGAGIGYTKARQLLAAVGPDRCLDVLKRDQKTVMQVCSVDKDKADLASRKLIEVEEFEAVAVQLADLFKGRGFQQKVTELLIKKYGVAACEKVKRDPFTMLVQKMPSAGFARCDQLYPALGLPKDRMKRQVICIQYLLRQADGSTWLSLDQVREELNRMISSDVNPVRAIKIGVRAKRLTLITDSDGKRWIGEAQDATDEYGIFHLVGDLVDGDSTH